MKTAEEILKRSAFDQYNDFFKVSLEDMNWFVEQAEMVEKLRKENWALNQEIGGYAGRLEALTEEFEMLTGRMKLLKTSMFNPK